MQKANFLLQQLHKWTSICKGGELWEQNSATARRQQGRSRSRLNRPVQQKVQKQTKSKSQGFCIVCIFANVGDKNGATDDDGREERESDDEDESDDYKEDSSDDGREER